MALWYVPSALVLLLVGGGVLGANTGALQPETGYGWFSWGIAIAGVSLLPLGVALLLEPLRGPAARAILVPLMVLFAGVVPSLSVLDAPAIHDITTDPEDTLLFAPDVAGGEREPGRATVLAEQRRGYPDIAPLVVRASPADAFQHAAEVARSMAGWRVTSVDAVRGRIQAHDTSRVFRFRDDVIIRVRPGAEGRGARIDVRSRSRAALNDRGVNAARIRAYLAAYSAGGFR